MCTFDVDVDDVEWGSHAQHNAHVAVSRQPYYHSSIATMFDIWFLSCFVTTLLVRPAGPRPSKEAPASIPQLLVIASLLEMCGIAPSLI